MSDTVTFLDKFVSNLKSAGVRGVLLEGARLQTIVDTNIDPWNGGATDDSNKRSRTEVAQTTTMIPEDPEAFVQAKVEAGKWLLVMADSTRANSEQYRDRPERQYLYEFVVDGSERSTFDNKETIKAAGFSHFSGSDRSGWKPFALVNNKKGFGREVVDAEAIDAYWVQKGAPVM